MSEWAERIANLSPAQRTVLAQRLAAHGADAPDADRAAVEGAHEAEGETTLVAYVVPRETHRHTLSPADLKAFLGEWLPAHMVPTVITVLDDLPRTPNGKVDRHALPDPEPAAFGGEAAPYVAPRTEEEQALADLWAGVLGFEPVGVHDDFFEMGGHSLLAIQLIGRVRDQFDVELPMQALFDAPTVAGMTAQIETLRWATSAASSANDDDDREEIEL